MQVTLVDYEGVPPESIVSIRAGGERRQAVVKRNHPFNFPGILQEANPIRIDVFSPLGSRLLSLDPRQARHTIDVAGGMKVVLDIQHQVDGSFQPQHGSQKVPAIAGFKTKLGQASEFNEYLERHNIVNFIQEIFLEMLHKMPDDPYSFLGTKLEGTRTQLSADAKLIEGEMRIDDLLDFMKEDKAEIKRQFGRASVCPDLPPELMQLMKDENFRAQCNAKFDSLDADGNGTLSAMELFPCIVEISEEHPYSVTIDHCERLLKIFDDSNSGNLTRGEFFEFVKFLYLMHYLDSKMPGPPPPAGDEIDPFDDEMLDAEIRVDELLDMMEVDRGVVRAQIGRASQCPDMPVDLQELMASEDFKKRCNDQFDQLDADKNGVLTVDELFPILDDISQEHPMAVTYEHCQRFLKIFDDSNSGNLTSSEFYEFVKFMYLMQWLESVEPQKKSKAKSDAAYDGAYDADAIEGEYRIHDLIDMMKQDKAAMKREFGRASSCPDIPPDLAELLASEEFKEQCNAQFDSLDLDKNGVLSADELFPVIVEVSQERQQSVTLEHCQQFLEIFDEGKSGNLIRTEFYDFFKFMYVMLWLDSAQVVDDSAAVAQGELRINDLLSLLKVDRSWVKNQFGRALNCPDIPADLQALMADETFKKSCEEQFDALDKDGNEVLDANELFPVIMQISEEHPMSVTFEHCRQFLEIFDDSKSGNLTRSEFFEFVKFLYLMRWIDAESQAAMDAEIQIIEGEMRIDDLLYIMKEDKAEVKRQFGRASLCPDMPPDLQELMQSEDFKKECQAKFDGLDKDKNGVLTADELFPVIEELSMEHPVSITYEHCMNFLETFDESKSGNLTREEFFDFVKFLYLMQWLDLRANQIQQFEGELRVDDLLSMMQQDRTVIKREFGRASLCPDIPADLQELMGSEEFKKRCEDRFDMLDADKNGTLSADELFPVLVEISEESPMSITFEHCIRFMEMFDDSKSGNLTRTEFFEFAKFMYLMMWIDSVNQQAAEEEAIFVGEVKIDELMDMMQHNKGLVRQEFGRASCCPDLPPDLAELLASDELKQRCDVQFSALDEDKNGVLSADELFPIIMEMTAADPVHPYSVTYEHCERLLKIFDDTNSGNLTKPEFQEFVKFMYLMSFLEAQMKAREMLAESGMRIDMMLDMLDLGVSQVRTSLTQILASPDLPDWLRNLLKTETFIQSCNAQFDELDVDKNGTLSPDELWPVIVELSREHPLSVTIDHCRYLTVIFDEDCNGVISRGEFAQLVQFIFIVQWLQEQPRPPPPPQDDSFVVDEMLDILQGNVTAIKQEYSRIIASPQTPEWLKVSLQSEEFAAECQTYFDNFDEDGNGFLSPDELFPIVQAVSQVHPVLITEEHCNRLSIIFDEDKNGVISRDEFANLTRFLLIIQWLQDAQAQKVAKQEYSLASPSAPVATAIPELEATNKQLLETQKTLQAVQEQLQYTTATMGAMLSSSGDPGSPVSSSERMQWEIEKKKLMDELAVAQQLSELQKKGMAETVGKLMVEKQELELQLQMSKMQG